MLYTKATIVTVNANRDIIEDGALLVEGSKIADIGKTEELLSRHPNEAVTDLEGRIVIPGLVNAHMHTTQTLLRGTADDLKLVSWLCERIWPLQGNFTPEDGYAAARLSIAEMLLSGTTCFLESMFANRYGFDGLCKAVEENGIRGCLGKIVMDVGTYASDPKWAMHPGLVEDRETSLLGAVAMHEKRDGKADGRIKVWLGARTPGGVSEGLYKEMASISRERNIPITMNCAEAPADWTFFASLNHTPMSYCSSVNLLGPQTVLVHMVHLDDTDITRLAETGTHVVHCPSSNTKLASGICKVPQLLEAGEMRLAGILHKVSTMNPTSVPAETVLELATINIAKALGLGDSIGSLEVGKKADLVVLDMRKVHLQPWHNPVSAAVYSATGRDVDIVVVDGKEVVRQGKLTTMNEEEIWKEAAWRSKEMVARAGLTKEVGERWPVK